MLYPAQHKHATAPEEGSSLPSTGRTIKCLSLILSAVVMQWFSLYWEAAPYLPLYLPVRMWPALALGIVGLVLWMEHRGRHAAWSLLGLIPVAGPLAALMIPPGQRNLDGRDIASRFWIRLHASTLVLLVAGWPIWGLLEWGHGKIIFASVSPDETARARIVLAPGIDNNFMIQSQRISGIFVDAPLTLHYSGDQCDRTGQFLWTKDNSRVLLIGPRYCVQTDGKLPNGQKLFFMYDFRTGHSWCNNQYTKRCEGHPSFEKSDLAGFIWDHPSALNVLDEPAARPNLAR